MGKAAAKCPVCYHKLPSPEDVLDPYDTELNYFMWIPGFEWRPKKQDIVEEDVASSDDRDGLSDDEDMQEALEEMVEKNEMKDKFQERASGGRISSKDAAVLARQLGLAPSYQDVEKLEESKGASIDFAAFEQFAAESTHPEDSVDDLVSAFAYFDPSNNGFLSLSQMRNILTTFGEPLTAEELSIVQSEFFTGEKINYRDFCAALLARK